MSRNDVSAQESQELPKLIQSFLNELTPTLLALDDNQVMRFEKENRSDIDEPSKRETEEEEEWLLYARFKQNCRKLIKLKRLLLIWDASMDQIVEWWTADVLIGDGFTPEDVRNLIWALFEHSDKREEAISIVSQTF